MSTVEDIATLHQELLKDYPGDLTVLEVLERQAQTLLTEHQNGNAVVCMQLSNWHPRFLRARPEAILVAEFSLEDARLTVAREHGFQDWQQVEMLDTVQFNPDFESAVDAIVSGDVDKLNALLQQSPNLVRETSPYAHKATLLHYVAANGVEMWRQRAPANAVAITQALIAAGAAVDAKMNVYGGQYDTMALLMTSAHPANAGLTEAIAAVLRDAGSSGT